MITLFLFSSLLRLTSTQAEDLRKIDFHHPEQCRFYQNPSLNIGNLAQITETSKSLERFCDPKQLGALESPREFNIRMDKIAAASISSADLAIEEFYRLLEKEGENYSSLDEESRRVWTGVLFAMQSAAQSASDKQGQFNKSRQVTREFGKQLTKELLKFGLEEFKVFSRKGGGLFIVPFGAAGLTLNTDELVAGHTRRNAEEGAELNAESSRKGGAPKIEISVDAVSMGRRGIELGRVFKINSSVTSANGKYQAALNAEFCGRKYSVGVGRRSSDECEVPAKIGATLSWRPNERTSVQGEISSSADIGKRRTDWETGMKLERMPAYFRAEVKLTQSFYIDSAGRPFERR